ncbi:MAG: hypothetical protein GY802_24335 [Gammaproteobacteria bacterium]|nr:hypothetical protein [Gammaproteobacteria bacterium]
MAQNPSTIADKGSYLLVEFSEQFSVASGKQCIDSMVEAGDDHGCSKVSLDCRNITGEMPVSDRFQVAAYGASKRQQIRRLALLNREDVMLPDNFVENVAVNRGMNMNCSPTSAKRSCG